jgi:hypothetical protein
MNKRLFGNVISSQMQDGSIKSKVEAIDDKTGGILIVRTARRAS